MSLRDFYIRRFSRIFPVFFVCVVVMFAFAFVVSLPFSWAEFLASLTFMRTYLPHSPGIFESGPTVHHLWSLNVEEHAYVFLSLLTLLFVNQKFIATVLLLVGLSLVTLAVYRYTQMSVADYRLYLIRTESAVVFILFSAGYGLLARRHGISVPAALPVVCLILAFFCYAEAAPLWLIIAICPVLLAVTVNHLNDMPALLKSVLSNSILRHFGFWSYSIYLWQQIFFQYHWRFPGGKFTAVLLAVLTGIVSYYFLEQPTRRWINSKWSPEPCYRAG